MSTVQPTTVRNPAPRALAFVDIDTDSGAVRLICEPINEWLAITPFFGMDSDGKTWLDGTFTVTHIPTGRNIVDGSGCIACCRHAGKVLSALAADWSTLTSTNGTEWSANLDEATQRAFAEARPVEWACDAEYCDDDEATPPVTTTERKAQPS